jgi:hypothetical protein
VLLWDNVAGQQFQIVFFVKTVQCRFFDKEQLAVFMIRDARPSLQHGP